MEIDIKTIKSNRGYSIEILSHGRNKKINVDGIGTSLYFPHKQFGTCFFHREPKTSQAVVILPPLITNHHPSDIYNKTIAQTIDKAKEIHEYIIKKIRTHHKTVSYEMPILMKTTHNPINPLKYWIELFESIILSLFTFSLIMETLRKENISYYLLNEKAVKLTESMLIDKEKEDKITKMFKSIYKEHHKENDITIIEKKLFNLKATLVINKKAMEKAKLL